MHELVPKRRRWWWLVLVAGLLLLGAPLARRFRPLNGTERALVGRWKGDYGEMTLSPDRRFEFGDPAFGEGPDATGTWTATDDQLFIYLDLPAPATWGDVWRRTRSFLLRLPPDSDAKIELLTPDQLKASGPTGDQPPEIWERIVE